MNIKPGMLCYLVNLPAEHSQFLGRVVTVVGRAPFLDWRVTAEWVPFEINGKPLLPYCRTSQLRPIHDPDADLTETHDEELTA